MKSPSHKALSLILVMIVLAVGWKFITKMANNEGGGRRDKQRPIPVEVGEVTRGTIEEIRIFSGSLEPSATLTLSSKVSGRVLRVSADLSDKVQRDEVLIELEPEEFIQHLARAEAEKAVAEAQVQEAKNRLEIAKRERERVIQLSERGISSAAAKDTVESELLIRNAALAVAKANLTAAESAVSTARLNLDETRIRARGSETGNGRFVSLRTVEEGDTVSPGQALLTLVDLQPVQAVIDVPEKDYGRLREGQTVSLTTDAWPGKTFSASIHRISPVFSAESRQARVEILAENPDLALKPGMFIRAAIVLDHIGNAVRVPESALTRRGDVDGVFTVDGKDPVAHWQEVKTGIRDGKNVQIVDPPLSGRVITLGQQLVDEGSTLILPESAK